MPLDASAAGRIHTEPATAERWDDLVRLMGGAGASNGCWCQYRVLGPDYHRRDRALNKDERRRRWLATAA